MGSRDEEDVPWGTLRVRQGCDASRCCSHAGDGPAMQGECTDGATDLKEHECRRGRWKKKFESSRLRGYLGKAITKAASRSSCN
jgi:hypothetical protein